MRFFKTYMPIIPGEKYHRQVRQDREDRQDRQDRHDSCYRTDRSPVNMKNMIDI